MGWNYWPEPVSGAGGYNGALFFPFFFFFAMLVLLVTSCRDIISSSHRISHYNSTSSGGTWGTRPCSPSQQCFQPLSTPMLCQPYFWKKSKAQPWGCFPSQSKSARLLVCPPARSKK